MQNKTKRNGETAKRNEYCSAIVNSIKSTWVAGGNEIGDSSFLQPSKLCHPLPGSCFVGIDLNSAIPKAREVEGGG